MKGGDWIGEEQLISSIPAVDTVKVTTEHATILALDTSSLNVVIKALGELKKQCIHKLSNSVPADGATRQIDLDSASALDPVIAQQDKEKFADNYFKKRMSRFQKRTSLAVKKLPSVGESVDTATGKAGVSLDRLERVGALGEGSFGTVLLMKDRETKQSFACKILSKKHIRAEKLGQSVKNERSVMFLLESDFIVRLFRTCQDDNYIFLFLEPVLGGELFDVYNDRNLFGELKAAKFYIACVTLALQHMHLRRVIYRDLKLENCLVDKDGYCKLTDMGIAKMVIGKTYTVCGTADYFAPETLKQTGHNRAADWWACGVLLFIMCSGRSPFDAPDVTQIYKNIVRGFSKVAFPETFPSDLTDVIKSLCRKKPEERVTMQKGGVDNLKTMPFFTALNWEELAERKIDPPFRPEITEELQFTKELSRSCEFDVEEIEDWDGGLSEVDPSCPSK